MFANLSELSETVQFQASKSKEKLKVMRGLINSERVLVDLTKESGKPAFISETGYPSGPSLLGYNASRQSEYIRRACSDAYGGITTQPGNPSPFKRTTSDSWTL